MRIQCFFRLTPLSGLLLSLAACSGGGGGGAAEEGTEPGTATAEPVALIQGANRLFDPVNVDTAAAPIKFLSDTPATFIGASLHAALENAPATGELTYDWSYASGGGANPVFFITDTNYVECGGLTCGADVHAEFEPPAEIQLKVLHNGTEIASTTRSFVGEDALPVAAISHSGELYETVDTGTRIDLSGRKSHDTQWRMLGSYAWALITTPQGSTASLSGTAGMTSSFTPDLPGDYVVKLTVTNSDGSQSATDELTITAIEPTGTPRLLAATEVHSPSIDPVVAATPYHVYPYLAYSSVPVTINEKTGRTITLKGVERELSVNPAGTLYRYALDSKPAGSSAVLRCSDASACTGDNDDPDRTLVLDVPGLYEARLVRVNGGATSKPALVTIVATGPDANAAPNLGEAEVSNEPIECASKEILFPWAVDPDGDELFFDFRLSYDGYNAYTGFGWYKYASVQDSARTSFNYTQFRTDTAGQYFATVMVRDKSPIYQSNYSFNYSQPLFVLLDVAATELADPACYSDSISGTGINDFYASSTDSMTESSSSTCQAGSACVDFVVNRALWGF